MRKPFFLLATFLFLAALLVFYRVSLREVYQSDNASALLMAKDMLHHNWLLKGWMLPSDNFIGTDIIFFLPLLSFFHFGPHIIQVVGIFLLAGITACSFFLAMYGLAEEKKTKALITTFALLVGSSVFLLQHLLSIPIHTGSLLYGLIIFCLYLFWEKTGQIVPLVLMSILGVLGFFSDPQFLIIGIAPVLVVAGKHYKKEQLWPVISLIGGVVVGRIALTAFQHHGAQMVDQPFIIGSVTNILSNIQLFIETFFRSFDAFFFGHNALAKSTLLLLFNTLKVGVLVWSTWWFTRRPKKELNILDELLFWGAILNVLAYFISSYPQGAESVRYLFPTFTFLAILAGRAIASSPHNKRQMIAFYAVLSLTLLIFLRHVQTIPQPVNTSSAIAESRLKSLGNGYGSYWQAQSTTLYANGSLVVSPIKIIDGQFLPYYWFSANAWYKQPAYFLVYDSKDNPDFLATALAVFGTPKEHFLITPTTEALVWDYDITPRLKHYEGLEK